MIGANLVLGCQRIDCDEEAVIEIGISAAGDKSGGIDDIVREDWPEGWGWDHEGANSFLHCAEHRS